MYQAEHLDLITNAQDQFSGTLTRLSGMLETIGQQADALDPIRIRVNVHDNELDELMAKMGAVEGMDAADIGSNRTPIAGLTPTDNTLDDTFTQMSQNIEEMSDAVNRADVDIRNKGVSQMASEMAEKTSKSVADAVTDGGGGGRRPLLSVDEMDRAEMILPRGFDLSSIMANRQGSTGNILAGTGALTGVAPAEIDDIFRPTDILRGFDFDEFNRNVFGTESPDAGPLFRRVGPRDIAGRSMRELAGAAGFDDMDNFLRQHINRRRTLGSRLIGSIGNLRVGMTQFYDIVAAGLPLLLTFVGAIPAVIGGVAALGAAAAGAAVGLGAIAGLGLLGAATAEAGGKKPSAEDFGAALSGITDDFFESFRDEAQRLAPLFNEALDGLSMFFDQLARATQFLDRLHDDARAFGSFMSDFIANTFAELIRFADAARPVFTMIAEGLSDRNIIRGLASVLRMTLPQLQMMTTMLLNSLPAITQFSQGMLQMATRITFVIKGMLGFVSGLAEMIPFVRNGNRFIGQLAGGLLMLTTLMLIGSKFTAILGTGLGAMAVKAVAAKLAFLGLNAAVTQLIASLVVLGAITGIGAIIGAIGAGVASLGGAFMNMSDSVDEATSSLKEFERQEQSMSGRTGPQMGRLDRTVYIDTVDNSVRVEGNTDRDTADRLQRNDGFDPSDSSTNTYNFDQ